jgi:hypothetical protein
MVGIKAISGVTSGESGGVGGGGRESHILEYELAYEELSMEATCECRKLKCPFEDVHNG